MAGIFRQFVPITLGALLLIGCSNTQQAKAPVAEAAAALPPDTFALTPRMEARAGIATAPVERQTLSGEGIYSTTIEAPTIRSGVVVAPVAGIVSRVLADVGQAVRRGDVLATIASPDLGDAEAARLTARARVEEARARIDLSTARAGIARADWLREQALYGRGVSALREVQAAEGRYKEMLAEVAAARTLLVAARSGEAAAIARLGALRAAGDGVTSELPLRSPVDGVVTARTIQPGMSVGPAMAGGAASHEHLFDIADLSRVWAVLEAPQAEAAFLTLGSAIEFTADAVPGAVFRGRIVRLGENYDPNTRIVTVRAEVANPGGRLKPGMLVLARARNTGGSPVLTVPTAAVQQVQGRDVVFVRVNPHTYRLQPVVLGARSGERVEIKGGLSAGQTVVTEGSFVLKSEALKATLGEE